MPATIGATHWWCHHDHLAAVYSWLRAAGRAPDPVDFLREPWRYDADHKAMIGRGSHEGE